MTREEKLAAIDAALAELKAIVPPQSGKAQHRCAVCVDSGLHPCPLGRALSALFEAHGIVWNNERHQGGER